MVTSTDTAKKQIWLRPDQIELAILCLEHIRSRLNNDVAQGAHAKVAGPFTYKRVGELIVLLGGKSE